MREWLARRGWKLAAAAAVGIPVTLLLVVPALFVAALGAVGIVHVIAGTTSADDPGDAAFVTAWFAWGVAGVLGITGFWLWVFASDRWTARTRVLIAVLILLGTLSVLPLFGNIDRGIAAEHLLAVAGIIAGASAIYDLLRSAGALRRRGASPGPTG